MRRIVPATAALLLVGLIFWYQADGSLRADEPVKREYSLSTDPTVEVLKVRFAGGMSGTVTSHTVFADGRFLLQFINPANNETVREHEIILSDEELSDLVSSAVHGGLIEYDKDRFQQLLLTTYVHDAATMFVDVNLDRYRGPSQREWGPASSSLSLQGVASRARRYEEIDEFQALAELARKINKYRRMAEAANE